MDNTVYWGVTQLDVRHRSSYRSNVDFIHFWGTEVESAHCRAIAEVKGLYQRKHSTVTVCADVIRRCDVVRLT